VDALRASNPCVDANVITDANVNGGIDNKLDVRYEDGVDALRASNPSVDAKTSVSIQELSSNHINAITCGNDCGNRLSNGGNLGDLDGDIIIARCYPNCNADCRGTYSELAIGMRGKYYCRVHVVMRGRTAPQIIAAVAVVARRRNGIKLRCSILKPSHGKRGRFGIVKSAK
jgi:hypothetical protein